jgi:multisubunit Na+/H+ antiporter MnhB subunit
MAVGIILFLLTIPLYTYFNIDTDIIGLTVFAIGLALCIIGIILRKKLHGWKLVILSVLAAVLLLPVALLIVSLVFYKNLR